MVFHFSMSCMNIMTCASQNTEVITFPVDCYDCGRFGRGSPVTVHRDDY
uniref:Uncharacterized protein n=1 Tax=Lepeophtheirus salmonis TaxID=72036 RepID=A0A0K2TF59_LEPSM